MFSARRKTAAAISLSGTKKTALQLQTPFDPEQRHEEGCGEFKVTTNFTNREPRKTNYFFANRVVTELKD